MPRISFRTPSSTTASPAWNKAGWNRAGRASVFAVATVAPLAAWAVSQASNPPAQGRPAAPLPGSTDQFYERRRIKRTAPMDFSAPISGRWDRLFSGAPGDSIRDAYLNWDNENLYIGVVTNEATEVRVDIDGAGDGWFRGADNLSLRAAPTPASNTGCLFTAQRFDTVQNPDRPVWAASPIPADEIRALFGRSPDDAPTTLFAIPRTELFKLVRKNGSSFGIRIEAGAGMASSGDSRSIAEKPLLRLELADSVDAAAGGLTLRFFARDRQIVPGSELRATLEAKNEGQEPIKIKRLFYGGSLSTEGMVDAATFTGVTLNPGQKYRRDIRSGVNEALATNSFVVQGGAERENGTPIVALTSFDRVEPYIVQIDTDDRPVRGTEPEGPGRKRLVVVTVRSRAEIKATAKVTLSLPPGWQTESESLTRSFGMSFATEVKSTSFKVIVPPSTAPGTYPVGATIEIGGKRYTVASVLRIIP